MSRRQELQDAHSTKLLNYGHLGTLAYDERHKAWGSLRTVEPHAATAHHTSKEQVGCAAFPLRHLSSKVVYARSAVPQAQGRSEANDTGLDDVGDCSSASTSCPSAKREDKSGSNRCFQGDAFTFAERQSASRSTLIAFGSANSTAVGGVRPEPVHIQIAASVSGSNAESVRLAIISNEATGSLNFGDEDTVMHVPYISYEGQAYWTSSGGPVQQVCFAAETGYPSTWMAARLESSTTILHPLLHRGPVPPRCETSQFPSQVLTFSVLDANPVIIIPISRTGDHPHADVSFHPQDHTRLALIDEHGNWSVWLIDGELEESSRSRFWITLICLGKIWTWDYEKRLRGSLPYHDGWHRILWCVGSETPSDELFICNRRTAAVYKTSGDLLGLKDLLLGNYYENQVILDVQWSRIVPGHCFVLTTTRVFWLDFKGTQTRNSGRDHAMFHVVLAWQHFRERGDRTLHLILLETGLTTVVLMVSRLVDLVLVFRVGPSNYDRVLLASKADPLSIFLPQHAHHVVSHRGPPSLLFRAIECCREVEVRERIEKPSLFKLFSLNEDLSIVEHLYLSTEPGFGPIADAALSSMLPLPVHKWLHRAGFHHIDQKDTGDFVVPADDWLERDGNSTAPKRGGDPRGQDRRKPSAQARASLDWQDVYSHLIGKASNPALGTRARTCALLQQFPDHLHQARRPGILLLSEVLPCKLHITDVDDDSDQFKSSVSALNARQSPEKKLELKSIILSRCYLPRVLTSTYDAIVAIHLASLPSRTPDRVRVNRERLARNVTADLLLASTAICPLPSTPTDALCWDASSKGAASQPIAHTSDAHIDTRPVSSSTTTTTASIALEEDQILTRLRKYTSISPPSLITPTSATDAILSSILRHIPTSPTLNPTTYNWRATERTLAEQQEEEIANAAGKADPRLRKKAEKAQSARIRKDEARRRAAEIDSSQRALPRVTSSQVGFLGIGVEEDERQVQSSQMRGPAWDDLAGSSQGKGQASGYGLGHQISISTTQPERGPFGMRAGVAGVGIGKEAKGKKRAAGF